MNKFSIVWLSNKTVHFVSVAVEYAPGMTLSDIAEKAGVTDIVTPEAKSITCDYHLVDLDLEHYNALLILEKGGNFTKHFLTFLGSQADEITTDLFSASWKVVYGKDCAQNLCSVNVFADYDKEFIETPSQYKVGNTVFDNSIRGFCLAALGAFFSQEKVEAIKSVAGARDSEVVSDEDSERKSAGSIPSFTGADSKVVPVSAIGSLKDLLSDFNSEGKYNDADRVSFWQDACKSLARSSDGVEPRWISKAAKTMKSETFLRFNTPFCAGTLSGEARRNILFDQQTDATGSDGTGSWLTLYNFREGAHEMKIFYNLPLSTQRDGDSVPRMLSFERRSEVTLANMLKCLIAHCFACALSGTECDFGSYHKEIRDCIVLLCGHKTGTVLLDQATDNAIKLQVQSLLKWKAMFEKDAVERAIYERAMASIFHDVLNVTTYFHNYEVCYYPKLNLGLAQEIGEGYLDRFEVNLDEFEFIDYPEVTGLFGESVRSGVNNQLRFSLMSKLEEYNQIGTR